MSTPELTVAEYEAAWAKIFAAARSVYPAERERAVVRAGGLTEKVLRKYLRGRKLRINSFKPSVEAFGRQQDKSLRDLEACYRAISLRNDLSHGAQPPTPSASVAVDAAEAFHTLFWEVMRCSASQTRHGEQVTGIGRQPAQGVHGSVDAGIRGTLEQEQMLSGSPPCPPPFTTNCDSKPCPTTSSRSGAGTEAPPPSEGHEPSGDREVCQSTANFPKPFPADGSITGALSTTAVIQPKPAEHHASDHS